MGDQWAEDLHGGLVAFGVGQLDLFLEAHELGLEQAAERVAGVLESVVFVIDLLQEGGGLGQDGVAGDRLAQFDQYCCGEAGDPVGGLLGEGLEFLLVGGRDRPGEMRVAADRGKRVGQRLEDRRPRFA